MKKWLKFFCLGFFSHKASKEGMKRGYTNVFLGFILALAFLFGGFVGAEMLPFGAHYGNSPDFQATVRAVLANADLDKRIVAEMEDGTLKLKWRREEYGEALLINTFESDADKQAYSSNGYNVVVDSRPATALAEVEAYCVSNDGKNTEISYEEYLALSEVARLNFDFELRYTGNELVLTDEMTEGYRRYVDTLGDANKARTEKLAKELGDGTITKNAYNTEIYKLYFTNYYPEITKYESTSEVPLLRNYYYHQYISSDADRYLFIFDDYIAGSFETKGGVEVRFYGFYTDLENGEVVTENDADDEAIASADAFIKNAFSANRFLNVYAHILNIFSLAPFIALMLMVATLLAYSLLKLNGVDGISSLGAVLKVVGSFVWFSGAVSALFALIISFFARGNMITALPLVIFFVMLIARSVVFVVKENRLHKEQAEQQAQRETEV